MDINQTDATLRAVLKAMRDLEADASKTCIVLADEGLILVARWFGSEYLGCYVARIIGEA